MNKAQRQAASTNLGVGRDNCEELRERIWQGSGPSVFIFRCQSCRVQSVFPYPSIFLWRCTEREEEKPVLTVRKIISLFTFRHFFGWLDSYQKLNKPSVNATKKHERGTAIWLHILSRCWKGVNGPARIINPPTLNYFNKLHGEVATFFRLW